MKSYKQNKMAKSQMKSIPIVIGEPLETRIMRAMTNNEPIGSESPLIYTERKEGVIPAYNIRSDKWEVAAEAMGSIEKSIIARSDQIKKQEEEAAKAAEEGGEAGT